MKKKTAVRDRYINRYRGVVTMPANSTTGVHSTFNTGMNIGRADPIKWVITHFAMYPGSGGSFTDVQPYGASQTLRIQLAVGTQTGFLQSDDMQLLCEGAVSEHFTTSGGWVMHWPIQAYLPSPIPVFSQALTVGIRSALDEPLLAGELFAYEIGYVIGSVEQGEILEYLAANGQV